MLTLGGDIQNMPNFFNLLIAKLVPIDNVAGNAGGTTIVIKSSARKIMVVESIPRRMKFTDEIKKPTNALQYVL